MARHVGVSNGGEEQPARDHFRVHVPESGTALRGGEEDALRNEASSQQERLSRTEATSRFHPTAAWWLSITEASL